MDVLVKVHPLRAVHPLDPHPLGCHSARACLCLDDPLHDGLLLGDALALLEALDLPLIPQRLHVPVVLLPCQLGVPPLKHACHLLLRMREDVFLVLLGGLLGGEVCARERAVPQEVVGGGQHKWDIWERPACAWRRVAVVLPNLCISMPLPAWVDLVERLGGGLAHTPDLVREQRLDGLNALLVSLKAHNVEARERQLRPKLLTRLVPQVRQSHERKARLPANVGHHVPQQPQAYFLGFDVASRARSP
mmetsp:Transcript_49763/g.121486  ORF Transcript_49763/g.121486 Transcript_49763/m.121486 type:complete len:248 (+) Transcript_49763:125-868(+)